MHYSYIKAPSRNLRKFSIPDLRKGKKISALLVIGGTLFLLSAIFPLINYQFADAPQTLPLIDPTVNASVLGEQENNVDYTQISNWFSQTPNLPPLPSKVTDYTLSIPKLRIKDAKVRIGGDDLKKSLIHYKGTGE